MHTYNYYRQFQDKRINHRHIHRCYLHNFVAYVAYFQLLLAFPRVVFLLQLRCYKRHRVFKGSLLRSKLNVLLLTTPKKLVTIQHTTRITFMKQTVMAKKDLCRTIPVVASQHKLRPVNSSQL